MRARLAVRERLTRELSGRCLGILDLLIIDYWGTAEEDLVTGDLPGFCPAV
jgi:hypothetical protein